MRSPVEKYQLQPGAALPCWSLRDYGGMDVVDDARELLATYRARIYSMKPNNKLNDDRNACVLPFALRLHGAGGLM